MAIEQSAADLAALTIHVEVLQDEVLTKLLYLFTEVKSPEDFRKISLRLDEYNRFYQYLNGFADYLRLAETRTLEAQE